MRSTTIPLLLLVLRGVAQQPAKPTTVEAGKEFSVHYGQEVIVSGEKLRIEFTCVPSDSRCPSGVTCIWAGNGSVAIEVSIKNKKKVEATLNTFLNPREISYHGFKIKLVDLTPYPKASEERDPKDYVATFMVTREE